MRVFSRSRFDSKIERQWWFNLIFVSLQVASDSSGDVHIWRKVVSIALLFIQCPMKDSFFREFVRSQLLASG